MQHRGFGDLEALIMDRMWGRAEPFTVREIFDDMVSDRAIAYTTVMTVLDRLAKKGLPFISILTDPTTGGVSASFAFMGDIVIAEPKALICFAGPRVIESTLRVTLPEGFQRAEFLQDKGAVDMVCDRRELRRTVANSLAMLLRQPADAVV